MVIAGRPALTSPRQHRSPRTRNRHTPGHARQVTARRRPLCGRCRDSPSQSRHTQTTRQSSGGFGSRFSRNITSESSDPFFGQVISLLAQPRRWYLEILRYLYLQEPESFQDNLLRVCNQLLIDHPKWGDSSLHEVDFPPLRLYLDFSRTAE